MRDEKPMTTENKIKRQITVDNCAKQASSAVGDIISEIEKVHGPIWVSRLQFCKLIISLASAILVGTITFAEKILTAHKASPCATLALESSWLLFFVSICSSLLTVWYAGIFKTIRARFVNYEPQFMKDASEIHADSHEEWVQMEMDIVKQYADAALNPIKPADERTDLFTRVALVTFFLGLAAFIVCGTLQVT